MREDLDGPRQGARPGPDQGGRHPHPYYSGVDKLTEHQHRLGKLVVKAQGLETIVSVVLAHSIGASLDVGSVLAGHMGLSSAIGAIEKLTDQPGYGLDAEAAKAWVILAGEAAAARNKAIHQPWAAVAENDEHTVGLNARLDRRRSKLTRADPASELERTTELLDRAMVEGAALAGILRDVSASGS